VEHLTDEELIARYRAEAVPATGQPFINELFRRHHSRVAIWCYRFTGDRESAADLAQEIFIKVYRHLTSFRGEAKFSTWLYSVARNHCRNAMKESSTRPEQTSATILDELPDHRGEDVQTALERMSSAKTLHAFLEETLEETERIVMTLHYGEELTLDAITRLLGLKNSSGAKAYIVSARRKLNAALQQRHSEQRREA
jgi:RNA polymerase sigma-70 factor (ECF subfamily)